MDTLDERLIIGTGILGILMMCTMIPAFLNETILTPLMIAITGAFALVWYIFMILAPDEGIREEEGP